VSTWESRPGVPLHLLRAFDQAVTLVAGAGEHLAVAVILKRFLTEDFVFILAF